MLPDAPPPAPLDVPPPSRRVLRRTSSLAAVILGLAVPGGGHVVVGRPGKALLFLVTIGGLFVLGLQLTGFTAIDPERHGLWAAAQAGITGPAFLTWHLTQGHVEPTALRWLDIGQLYVGIAGLLNLVAVTDAWGHALRHNDRVDRWRRASEAQAAREPEVPA
ncbi:MAG: DUF6677 family protein [Planctomycetota bacterium]